MKSQFQTLSFLSNYTPKSPLDEDFIKSFAVKRFKITPKTPIFASQSNFSPLDVESFIRWFESGSETLKIALHGNNIVLLGNCTLENCEIIASLASEGSLSTEILAVPSQEITEASPEQTKIFQEALRKADLQPDPNTLRLVPKFTPGEGDRVIFFDFAKRTQGVGVVRSVDEAGNVIFYCYYTYPPTESDSPQTSQLGYNMHENPGYDLNSFVYESIDKENIQTSLGNSTSIYRRLIRELEKRGKVWKDKSHRIEPLNAKVPKGAKYWYISDKMQVVTEYEKDTATSHSRFLRGNYFVSQKEADKMASRIRDMLRDYLASDSWPVLED